MQKKIHLEIIRILALVCIVYDHTGPRGSSLYTFTDGRLSWGLSLASAVVCKVGVPLFFMISGALLLAKEEGWKTVYGKRVLRILQALLVFTLLRFLYEGLLKGTVAISLGGFLEAVWTGNLFLPYWFLYTYLGILLVLPFLRKMMWNLNHQEKRLLAVLLMAVLVVQPLLHRFGMPDWGLAVVFTESLGCFLLGYILEFALPEEKAEGRIAATLVMGGIVVWILNAILTAGGEPGAGVTSVGTMVPAAALFWLVRQGTRKLQDPVAVKVVSHLGGCVFGIYLIEDYLRNGLAFIWEGLAPRISALPACAIWLMVVLAAGFVLVSFLKKVPILGKLL